MNLAALLICSGVDWRVQVQDLSCTRSREEEDISTACANCFYALKCLQASAGQDHSVHGIMMVSSAFVQQIKLHF